MCEKFLQIETPQSLVNTTFYRVQLKTITYSIFHSRSPNIDLFRKRHCKTTVSNKANTYKFVDCVILYNQLYELWKNEAKHDIK